MKVESSDSERVKKLPWAIAHQSLNAVSTQLTFAGPVFVLVLARAGLTMVHIGLLLALFPLTSLITLVIARHVSLAGYKRIYIGFYLARTMLLAMSLLTPAVFSAYGQLSGVLFLSLLIALFALLRAIAESGYNPWFQEFVPNPSRSRFSLLTNLTKSVASITGLALVAFAVSDASAISAYGAPIFAGVITAVVALTCATMIPNGARRSQNISATRLNGVIETLHSTQFRTYLIGLGLITLGIAPLTFVPLLLKDRAGLSDGTVIGMAALTLVGSMVSNNLWNWAAQRWGNKPITILSLTAVAIMPVAWLLVPAYNDWSIFIALMVSITAGLVNSAWGVASISLLFSTVIRDESKADFLTTNFAWAALTSGVGFLIAGGILELLKTPFTISNAVRMDPYVWLSIFSFLACVSSIYFFRKIGDYKAIRIRDLMTTVVRGNPIKAAASLIKYRRARAESERISVTESMGSARSMLTIDELLDAIVDPSFNVRHEAIVAITRMKPDQRLIDALIEVLHDNEPDLSVSAVWALGRLGDKCAIGSLRELLESRYSLIRAHAARALATLGDGDVIPILLDKFDAELDDAIRIAYASALGALHSRDSVQRILPLLYQSRGNDVRMDLALSLARIIGSSDQFVLLSRYVRAGNRAALSQSIIDLQHRKLFHDDSVLLNLVILCAAAFTRDDLSVATQLLSNILMQSLAKVSVTTHLSVLRECSDRLKEYGAARPEYVILALHALHHAQNTSSRSTTSQ